VYRRNGEVEKERRRRKEEGKLDENERIVIYVKYDKRRRKKEGTVEQYAERTKIGR
jgi:hypothetical protein